MRLPTRSRTIHVVTTPSSPATLIDDLPSEILHTIAELTNRGDIPSLRLCCRRFNAIFTPFYLESIKLVLSDEPTIELVRQGPPQLRPFGPIPDVFARYIPSLQLAISLDFTMESLHAASDQLTRDPMSGCFRGLLGFFTQKLATITARDRTWERSLQRRPVSNTILRNTDFWKDLSRFKSLKKLDISFFNSLGLQIASEDLLPFLDNLIDEVTQATSNGLMELILDVGRVVEFKSLPDALTRLTSLTSFTLKRSCGEQRDTWVARPQPCCALPIISEQLRSIMANNPSLQSFKYRYECSQPACRPSLYDILPSNLTTLNIKSLAITGHILPTPVQARVAPSPFLAFKHLQHLQLTFEYSDANSPLQRHTNIDHLWYALMDTGIALKTIITAYISPAFINYLTSFRGLQTCAIDLPRGCFSSSLSFADLRNAYSVHSATLEILSVSPIPSNTLSEEYTDILFYNPLTSDSQRSWFEPVNYPKLRCFYIPCLFEPAIMPGYRDRCKAYLSHFSSMKAAVIRWFDRTAAVGFHAYVGVTVFELEDDSAVETFL